MDAKKMRIYLMMTLCIGTKWLELQGLKNIFVIQDHLKLHGVIIDDLHQQLRGHVRKKIGLMRKILRRTRKDINLLILLMIEMMRWMIIIIFMIMKLFINLF